MSSLGERLSDILDKVQKNGRLFKRSTRAEAEFFKISQAQWSRIKNGRSSLGDQVVKKILAKCQEVAPAEVMEIERELRDVQSAFLAADTPSEARYAIGPNMRALTAALSNTRSLAMVDYRDHPQSDPGGSHPEIAESVIDAVNNGLQLALFSPFGSPLSIYKRMREFDDGVLEKTSSGHLRDFLTAYQYLYDLATRIHDFYKTVKNGTSDAKGAIVLYEADYRDDKERPHGIPTIVASGILSRLFYVEIFDGKKHVPKVFEWVVGTGRDEHLFIERGDSAISFVAVKMQFSPIPSYWSANGFKLPATPTELETAYSKYGLDTLTGKQFVRWQIATVHETETSIGATESK